MPSSVACRGTSLLRDLPLVDVGGKGFVGVDDFVDESSCAGRHRRPEPRRRCPPAVPRTMTAPMATAGRRAVAMTTAVIPTTIIDGRTVNRILWPCTTWPSVIVKAPPLSFRSAVGLLLEVRSSRSLYFSFISSSLTSLIARDSHLTAG